jgi:hypothetical protein
MLTASSTVLFSTEYHNSVLQIFSRYLGVRLNYVFLGIQKSEIFEVYVK